MKLLALLKLHFLPAWPHLALLVLRVWIGLSMLLLHGSKKLFNFSVVAEKFIDPFNLGSPKLSLALALGSEVVGSALLILGLFTRLAALGGIVTMSVALFFVHKTLTGSNSGELAFLYLAGYVALFLSGAGRFSLDRR